MGFDCTAWQSRQLEEQLFGVVRHTERADRRWSSVGGKAWVETDEAMDWPLDAPLSDTGRRAADDLGRTILAITDACGSKLHVVISSPYCRCLQTALAICRALGPGVRLLVDEALGEIYGPSTMGPTEPRRTARPLERMPADGSDADALKSSGRVGEPPAWPEDVQVARRRFASRFLTYLQRGTTARRNFLLVTHADCVAAALTMLPSHAGQTVQSIEYGAMFFGKRRVAQEPPPASASQRCARLLAMATGLPSRGIPRCGGSRGQRRKAPEPVAGQLAVGPLRVTEGWRVQTYGMKLCNREDSITAFERRAGSIEKSSSFTRDRMEKLLGELRETAAAAEATASDSTMIFGASSGSVSDGDAESPRSASVRRRQERIRRRVMASSAASEGDMPVSSKFSDTGNSSTDESHVTMRRARRRRRNVLSARSRRTRFAREMVLELEACGFGFDMGSEAPKAAGAAETQPQPVCSTKLRELQAIAAKAKQPLPQRRPIKMSL